MGAAKQRDSAQTSNTGFNQKYLEPNSANASDKYTDYNQRDSQALPKQDDIYDYYYNDPMSAREGEQQNVTNNSG